MAACARVELQTALFIRMYEILGAPLAGKTVLDFGCGEGGMVRELLAAGIDAYGCDFPDELGQDDRLGAIEQPYRLPFPDATFDAVLSSEVFEHVRDYTAAFREIRRVLRPGGLSIHTFPTRYLLLEPHVLTPFATIVRSRPWLLLWATLGVRNSFQNGKRPSEVADLNHRYLTEQTNYLRRREILRLAREVFPDARLLTSERLQASEQLKSLARTHVAGVLYGELRSRTLLLPG